MNIRIQGVRYFDDFVFAVIVDEVDGRHIIGVRKPNHDASRTDPARKSTGSSWKQELFVEPSHTLESATVAVITHDDLRIVNRVSHRKATVRIIETPENT